MSDEFSIEFDEDAIGEIVELGLNAVRVAIGMAARDFWGNIRSEAPVDEGRLAGSWQIEQVDDLTWRIFTNVLYALFVQEGTGIFGPHGTPIVPVSASFLVFEIAGETIFARSVRGMEANPYVDRAMELTESNVEQFAELALAEVGAA